MRGERREVGYSLGHGAMPGPWGLLVGFLGFYFEIIRESQEVAKTLQRSLLLVPGLKKKKTTKKPPNMIHCAKLRVSDLKPGPGLWLGLGGMGGAEVT